MDASDASGPTVSPDDLDALHGLDRGGTWTVEGREIKLTNLDKVLFPGRDDHPPVTKRDLIRYLAVHGHRMLPFVQGRAINCLRHPDGVENEGFWQKARPKHAPAWVLGWDNPRARTGETRTYIVIDGVATLVWLAQQGVVEWHPWTSPTDAPGEPSWALIDIDPGPRTTLEDLYLLAGLFRTALDHLGVVGAPKTTGQSGLQIWIPVRRGYTFTDTSDWVEGVSRSVGAVVPELISWKWPTAERGGRARLDFTQNAVNKTLVAPYSTRAKPGAPLSVPLEWDELQAMADGVGRPDRYTIHDADERWDESADPTATGSFDELVGMQQELPPLA